MNQNELLTIDQAFPDMGPKDALAGARLMAELTQARLAAMIGVHRHHISEMETGKRKITLETAKRLAKVLNTSYKIFL
ncbi:MAG: helix-turn-helix transcriptional regulator [Thermodesulfobacteriota bacterium]|nr:helix-turn-helix transcriptional regulator [Thermodesulfobacteriota bacterium]